MKTAVKKSVVIFEISDSGREWETSGESYVGPLAEFISTLGFDAQKVEAYKSDEITIDGVKFFVNHKSASYKAKSGWTREISVRKPQNRFVGLMAHSFDKEHIVKIFFNKEYDGNEIRKKIEAAITKHNDTEKWIADRQASDKENTTQLAKHYLAHPTIKKYSHSISVHEKTIIFYVDKVAKITTAANGDLKEVYIYAKEIHSENDVDTILKKQITDTYLIQAFLNEIKAAGPVSFDIQEWSEKAHNRSFHVETMKYSKH